MKTIHVVLLAIPLLSATAGLAGCVEQTIKPLSTKLEVCEMINALTKESLENYSYIKVADTKEIVQAVFNDMKSKNIKLDATQEWQMQQRITQVATYAKSGIQTGEELMNSCLQLPDAQVGFGTNNSRVDAQ
jgi:hypothetical protein